MLFGWRTAAAARAGVRKRNVRSLLSCVFLFWQQEVENVKKKLKEEKRLQKELEEADRAVCGICMDECRPVNTLLQPCLHLLCADCAPLISSCPFCRGAIEERVRLVDVLSSSAGDRMAQARAHSQELAQQSYARPNGRPAPYTEEYARLAAQNRELILSQMYSY